MSMDRMVTVNAFFYTKATQTHPLNVKSKDACFSKGLETQFLQVVVETPTACKSASIFTCVAQTLPYTAECYPRSA